MNRSFWNGIAMGAALGMMVGLTVMSRRRELTPMEKTKAVMGRKARHAVRKAQGAWSEMAGRFSG